MANKLRAVLTRMDSIMGFRLFSNLCFLSDIIAVEEHWLAPYNLDKFTNINSEFKVHSWSAMTDKISSGFLTGRPFGGLGLFVRKTLNVKICVLEVKSNCRDAAVCCTFPLLDYCFLRYIFVVALLITRSHGSVRVL